MSKNATIRTSDVINATIGRVTNDDLEQAVAVWFKDEDEDEETGVALGPIWIQVGGSTPNENDNPMPNDGRLEGFHRGDGPEWYTIDFAQALASELRVQLVRS